MNIFISLNLIVSGSSRRGHGLPKWCLQSDPVHCARPCKVVWKQNFIIHDLSCFPAVSRPTTRSNVFSAWLCKMFLSVSLPCPALIIATPSQPSIRQVRHLTFLLVHSFCNIFTLFTFLFLSYFHFHRNMIKTFVSTCVQGSKLLFTCAFTSFYCYSE